MTTNTITASPAVSSQGSMLVNQIEVDQKPLSTLDSVLMQVALTNQEGQHETAVITTKLVATQVDAMKDKTVAFQYGPTANRGTFYGYVNQVSASKVYQQDGVYDIECFGTTNTLSWGKPRFYRDKTGPQIVSDVVTSHNLGLQVDESSFTFPTYGQTDQTDWAFIVEVAANLGFSIYSFSGVVRMADPLRILNGTGPVLRLIRGNDVLDESRQLLDFMPTSKSVNLASMVTPVFGFFDNGKVTLTHPVDSSHRLYTDSPVLNRTMAKVAQDAWESNPTRWTQQAQGRIKGNASILPGTVVDIQSSGSSVIENDYDGLWLVRGMQHVLTTKSYQTMITLARDDTPRTGNIDYRPFWTTSPFGRPQVVRKGDVWESSWKSVSTLSSHLTPVKTAAANHVWEAS